MYLGNRPYQVDVVLYLYRTARRILPQSVKSSDHYGRNPVKEILQYLWDKAQSVSNPFPVTLYLMRSVLTIQ
jgi:hypothetical protein